MKIVIESRVCGPHHIKGVDHEPEGEPIILMGGFKIDVCNAVRPDMEKLVKNVRAMADIPEEYETEEEQSKPAAKARKTTSPAAVKDEIKNNQ